MADLTGIVRVAGRNGGILDAKDERSIVFAACLSRATDDTVVVTQNPVEAPEGGKPALAATDHVIVQPVQLALQVVLNDFDSYNAAVPGRAVRQWEMLRALMYSGELVTYTSPKRIYRSMLIQQVSTPEDAGNSALDVDLQMLEVRIAQREYAEVPAELLRQPVRSAPETIENDDAATDAGDEADDAIAEAAGVEGSALWNAGEAIGLWDTAPHALPVR